MFDLNLSKLFSNFFIYLNILRSKLNKDRSNMYEKTYVPKSQYARKDFLHEDTFSWRVTFSRRVKK